MTASPREFELCVETLQACAAAAEGGADRIELCAALGEGGVTPSHGLIRVALTFALPVHLLVRPRGGDFIYSDDEFRAMCTDVEDAVNLGVAGIVTGMLTTDGEVDRERTATLVRLAAGRPVTFHRAFDHTRDLRASLETLIGLGCSRVLTSGGKPTVMEGRETLASLIQQAAGRIRIAAGGGVTLANAADLLRIDGLDLHASLRGHAPAAPAGDPLWSASAARQPIAADAVRSMSRLVHA